jgi:hypothetical protein
MMPTWLADVLSKIGPMTELVPAAQLLGQAIAVELTGSDALADKLMIISADIATFAGEIENALKPAPELTVGEVAAADTERVSAFLADAPAKS